MFFREVSNSSRTRPISVLSTDTSSLISATSFSTSPTRSSSRSMRVLTSVRKVTNRDSLLSLRAMKRSSTALKRSLIASNLRL